MTHQRDPLTAQRAQNTAADAGLASGHIRYGNAGLPFGPGAAEAKGGPAAPVGTLTGRQHLWLLGANLCEFATFSTSGPANLVTGAFAGTSPTGAVVATPPTELMFQDGPEP